jgi:DNA-binding beta-propeller fold protein YncE
MLIWSVAKVGAGQAMLLAVATLATFLALLTTRTMTMANYINYDLAKEFLVYAHGTPDIKKSLAQIRDISWRTTESAHGIKVAYGEDGSWPMTWYMVDFPNEYFYGTEPNPETLQECPAVIAGQPQWAKVDPILSTDYIYFEYKYLWWPIQDYYDLTWPRIRNALNNPELRAGVWDIIWDRDYARYAEAMTSMGFTRTITLQEWPYRKDYRLYVRRDVAQDVWTYRLGPEGVEQVVRPEVTPPPDPYAAGVRMLPVQRSIILPGANPRDIALAPDQTMYVADTLGHRIWHVDPSSGEVLHSWGEYGVGEGQFSEPWGVAVDDAGNVYVADTWNHRIQKFDAQGTYLLHWGTFAQVGMGDASGWGNFFGPRDIAIGPDNNVYVTDTGNKRVQVFDAEGAFLRQFGGGGREAGQMDEPVGIAMDEAGQIFIADTWNHRIQILTNEGLPLRQWDLTSWQLNNPEEKPFLAVHEGMVYVSVPTQGRVLAFTSEGTYVWAVEQGSDGISPLTFPEGVLVGPDNMLYVADAHTGKIIGFQLP